MEEVARRGRDDEPLRVLEFYSGIGGMRYSLMKAGVNAEIVEAFEINDIANDVYEYNFGHRAYQGNIQSLNAADLDNYQAHVWLLSPPCQPYTRQGLQKDSRDARAFSFLNILELMPELSQAPVMVFVENVVGFEASDTHRRMIEVLEQTGFVTQEFILSPLQFGVPYSRPRYFCLYKFYREKACPTFRHESPLLYTPGRSIENATTHFSSFDDEPLQTAGDDFEKVKSQDCITSPLASTAKRKPASFKISQHDNQLLCNPSPLFGHCDVAEINALDRSKESCENLLQSCKPIEKFLEFNCLYSHNEKETGFPCTQNISPALSKPVKSCEETIRSDGFSLDQYFVPVSLIDRWGSAMDSRRCCCFTKSYYRYVKGTGSLLANIQPKVEDKVSSLKEQHLRYFTPREVANLHSFPEEFCFPEHISLRQRYALLGNSLSIAVVAPLLGYLFAEPA